MTMKHVFSVCLSMALVLTAVGTAAHGALLIEEEFDYDLATWDLVVGSNNHLTTTGLNGGTGFAAGSEWGVCLQSTTPDIEGVVSVVDGLEFGTLETNGGALFTQNTDNSALASRPIGVTVDAGTTVWASLLWSYTETPKGSVQCSYSQLTDAQFGTTNRRLRILPNQYGSKTDSGISDGSAMHNLSRSTLEEGDTYLMVGKYTNIGQSGEGTLWALSEADFTVCADDGVVTEQELNDNCAGTVTGALGMNTMTSGAFLQLAHVWGAGTFDEFRMGTMLEDVTPISQGPGPGLQGDLDGDGFVGSADLDIVRGAWGEMVAGGAPEGDPSGDGTVGSADLDIVRGNWGATASATAVPEPSALLIALLGFAASFAIRRR